MFRIKGILDYIYFFKCFQSKVVSEERHVEKGEKTHHLGTKCDFRILKTLMINIFLFSSEVLLSYKKHFFRILNSEANNP